MGLNIKNPEVEARIRAVAIRDGVGLTEAIDRAVRAYLGDPEEERRRNWEQKLQKILKIQDDLARSTTLDPRRVDVIMDDMYDEHGLPA